MTAQQQAPAAAPTREAEPLAPSEDRFRALVEQSIAGIYVIQDGRVVYANPKLCEILGYPSEDFAHGGIPLDQITFEPDWPTRIVLVPPLGRGTGVTTRTRSWQPKAGSVPRFHCSSGAF